MSDRTPRLLVLDDRPYEITHFAETVKDYGITFDVCRGPLEFAERCESFKTDLPIAIIVDAHLAGVADLSAFGLPNEAVPDGEFAGRMILERILLPEPRYKHVPKAILSSFVKTLEDDPDRKYFVFNKGEPRKFEEFLRTLLVEEPLLPEFSFGAVVTPVGADRDGTIVELLRPAYDEIVRRLVANPRLMYEVDPRAWEEIIAASYKNAGYDEVVLTPRSGDLGRDVIAVRNGFGAVKIIDQVKAYAANHIVTAHDVRALVGVLATELDASKAVFTTTSTFAPLLREDRLLKPLLPTRLELVDKTNLISRLSWRH